jgi:hypothetical protein
MTSPRMKELTEARVLDAWIKDVADKHNPADMHALLIWLRIRRRHFPEFVELPSDPPE